LEEYWLLLSGRGGVSSVQPGRSRCGRWRWYLRATVHSKGELQARAWELKTSLVQVQAT